MESCEDARLESDGWPTVNEVSSSWCKDCAGVGVPECGNCDPVLVIEDG